MRPYLLVTLVTISPAHPAKAEVLLTFMTANFNLQNKSLKFLSFELLVMKSMQPPQSIFIATVYRPSGPYTAFLTEFPGFLSDLVVIAYNIQIFGDFNIHMEKSTDTLQKVFGAIIDSVGFGQHVSGPTHCHSQTLYLVLSRRINVVDLNVFPLNPGLIIGPPFYYVCNCNK